MDAFVRTVKWLSIASGFIAAASLAVAVIVVCQMVILRYFLQESTIWQTEFVTYLIVGATFIGSPYVLLLKGHVNVDLLPLYLGHRGRMALALFSSVLSLIFCLLLAWTGFEYLLEAWQGGWRTDTVWAPPLWITIIPLPIGIGLLVLQYLADILCLVTGRELPFGLKAEERP